MQRRGRNIAAVAARGSHGRIGSMTLPYPIVIGNFAPYDTKALRGDIVPFGDHTAAELEDYIMEMQGKRGRHGEKDRDGREEKRWQARHRGHGGRPKRKGYRALVEKPGTHLLFIGSCSCTRHKGTEKLELQREGKLTFLQMEEIDWITGGYLKQIEEAAREIAAEVCPKHLVLFGGCQIELLSTDYETMTQNLSRELGIDVHFHKGCHLVGYDPDAEE